MSSRADVLASLVDLLKAMPGWVDVTWEGTCGRGTFRLPPPGAGEPSREKPPGAPGGPGEPTGGCGADVLRVLREAGCRLTVPQILDDLTERGLEHSQRNVERWLQILRENGHIDHDKDARPPGYGAHRNKDAIDPCR